MKTITALVVRAIDFCAQYAWPVIAVAILLPILSSWYAATHFSMTTDINQLISPNIPWRQREAAFEKAFPQFEMIVAVIDAPTPELVDEATDALVQRLSQQQGFVPLHRGAERRRVLCAERSSVRARPTILRRR